MLWLSPEEQETIAAYENDEVVAEAAMISFMPGQLVCACIGQLCRLVPAGKILDVGCGSAGHSQFFVSNPPLYEYVGIDFSNAMLHVGRFHGVTEPLIRMDMRSIGFRDNSFDGFLAICSLPFIPKSKILSALHGIRRVIKTGGFGTILMADEGTEEKMVGETKGQRALVVRYLDSEFVHILAQSGFDLDYRLDEMAYCVRAV